MSQFIALKSSAGSGKTFSLTRRYLSILLADMLGQKMKPCGPGNILAITFTNKAAAEMRSRIIEWIKRVILGISFDNSAENPLTLLLTEGEGVHPSTGTERLQAAAAERLARVFDDLLRHFYDFKVSTIDSFVHLTLRASAFKLQLPPDFEISTRSSDYFDIVLNETLRHILDDERVRRQFDRFVTNYLELEGERASWVPKAFLRSMMDLLWQEESKESAAFNPAPTRKRMTESGRRLESLVASLRDHISSSPGLKLHAGFVKALEQFAPPSGPQLKVSAFLQRPSVTASVTKASALPEEALEDRWREFREALGSHGELLAASKFSSYLDIYGVFKGFLTKELTYRRRLLLIEELNRLLRAVVGRSSFVPEVYYSLADRYHHFLIDEFQDTNGLQWHNIAVLADEALSRGGTLFVVGDKKQSIYRWRGADTGLVDHLLSRYRSFSPLEIALTTNYRSGEHIVAFNNLLFHRDNLRQTLQRILGDHHEGVGRILAVYDDTAQDFTRANAGLGYVSVERVVVPGDDDDVQDQFSKDERFRVVGERMRELVGAIRSRGTIRDADIAILLRRRDEMEFVANLLLTMGIAVESDLTVDVRNNRLVKEVLALLSFLDSIDDDLSLATFLEGEIFTELTGLPCGCLHGWIETVRLEEERIPLAGFLQRDFPALWEKHLAYFVRNAGFFPLYELLLTILKRCRVLENFPDDRPYLLHLCEMLQQTDDSSTGSLSTFVRFWREHGNPDDRGTGEGEERFLLKAVEGTDAVKVLTIHKAKGLQFPLVILPFLKLTNFAQSDAADKNRYVVREGQSAHLLYINAALRACSPALDAIASQREAEYLLDELNGIYVALTRAKGELYVLLTDSKRQRNFLIDHCFALSEAAHRTTDRACTFGIEPPLSPHVAAPSSAHDSPERPPVRAPEAAWLPGNGVHWIDRMRSKLADGSGLSRARLAARRKGDLIHYILSLVASLGEDGGKTVRDAVASGLARHRGAADPEEVASLLKGCLSDPRFEAFFRLGAGETVLTELEVVDGAGQTHKIDRVIVSADHIDVIDFKTGETESAEHKSQIMRYGQLLSAIYPGKEIRKFLLYVDERRVLSL